jgi:hypothetical protein
VTTAEAVRPARAAPAHGLVRTLAHEAPMAVVMLAVAASTVSAGGAGAVAGGAGPAVSCAGALALALLSFAYGRAARRSAFAREHLVDLWAMVLAMVGMAFASAPAGGGRAGAAAVADTGALAGGAAGHRHLVAAASEPIAGALLVVALAGWLIGRALLARRVRRVHTLVSAVVCGGMLAAMLAM